MSALQLFQMIMWIILVLFCYCVCKIAPEMFSQEPSQTVISEHTADTKSHSQTLSHWCEAHVRVCSAKLGCSYYRSKCDQHLWYDATCSFFYPLLGLTTSWLFMVWQPNHLRIRADLFPLLLLMVVCVMMKKLNSSSGPITGNLINSRRQSHVSTLLTRLFLLSLGCRRR